MGTLIREAAQLFRVAAPMMAAQGGMVLMGVVDTMVVGRVSAVDVAAVGLGNNVANIVLALGVGLAMGTEPFVAQAKGRGDEGRALAWLRQSVWLSLFVSVPAALGTLGFPWVFGPLAIEDQIAEGATAYVAARVPGHLFCFLFSTYRSFLSAMGHTQPVLWAVLWTNVANLLMDLLFVWTFGMGALGVGLATSLGWVLLFLLSQRAVRRSFGVAFRWTQIPNGRNRPDFGELNALVRIGLPVALQFVLEVGIFAVVAVLVATLGAIPLAGHQIAITMASLTFMLATGIAAAATARVGFHIGAETPRLARYVGLVAVGMGVLLMAVGGLTFLLLGTDIARAFAPAEPQVVAAGRDLLVMAALFSLSDGVQAVAAGALRGVGDTRFAFGANVVGYWMVGLPVSWVLGLEWEYGAVGLWWGLVVGLTAVALALLSRFIILSGRPLSALEA
ncbi:MAG: MATE family efflux transporter [Myxococcota bacterium]